MAGLGNLVRGKSAGALDLHEPCCIEEENVTQGSKGIVPDPDVPLDAEQIGVGALDGEAARIVVDVVLHALQLAFSL